MSTVLWLLSAQGVIGAFDTLYYHEYRARLPAVAAARGELKLHAVRDFVYAVIFATLPFIQWRGAFAAVLFVMVAAEICITVADFIVEDTSRRETGGVYPGERASHTLMALIYGAALAYWLPEVLVWWRLDTDLTLLPPPVPEWLRGVMVLMAAGVFVSGVRDWLAATRGISWPWTRR
jgi:hypothetical protein